MFAYQVTDDAALLPADLSAPVLLLADLGSLTSAHVIQDHIITSCNLSSFMSKRHP